MYVTSYPYHNTWIFLWKRVKYKTTYKINNKHISVNLEMFTNSFHLTLKSYIDTLQIISWYNKINKMVAFALELENVNAHWEILNIPDLCYIFAIHLCAKEEDIYKIISFKDIWSIEKKCIIWDENIKGDGQILVKFY